MRLSWLDSRRWQLPRERWDGLWKNGLSLRYFLGTLVLWIAAVSSFLKFSLLGLLGAIGFACLAAVLWLLTVHETNAYFDFDVSDD
jgi:hypothetical protein